MLLEWEVRRSRVLKIAISDESLRSRLVFVAEHKEPTRSIFLSAWKQFIRLFRGQSRSLDQKKLEKEFQMQNANILMGIGVRIQREILAISLQTTNEKKHFGTE